jgi:hypothetical protein
MVTTRTKEYQKPLGRSKITVVFDYPYQPGTQAGDSTVTQTKVTSAPPPPEPMGGSEATDSFIDDQEIDRLRTASRGTPTPAANIEEEEDGAEGAKVAEKEEEEEDANISQPNRAHSSQKTQF